MPLSRKSGIGTLCALLLMATTALADTVPVRVGHHDGFTRIVFDMPKLLAYHVKPGDKGIAVDLDTRDALAFSAKTSPFVKGIWTSTTPDGLTIVEIATVPGVTTKHYRLQRKIVIDLEKTDGAKEPPKKEEKKPEPKKAEKPAAPKPVAKPAPAPTPAPEPTATLKADEPPPQTQLMPAPVAPPAPASTIAAAIDDPAARAEVKLPEAKATAVLVPDTPPTTVMPNLSPEVPTPAAAKPLDEAAPDKHDEETAINADDSDAKDDEEARITISFLDETKIAVFERADSLWLVMDSQASGSPPIVSGAMSAFIAQPKVLRFKDGTAYQYTFPKKFYPRVRKGGLTWSIQLMTTPQPLPPDVEIKLNTDNPARTPKIMAPLTKAGPSIRFEDPTVGDVLLVIPTGVQEGVVRNDMKMPDFTLLPATLGMVVRPLKAGVEATTANDYVFLSNPKNGLSVTPQGVGTPVLIGDVDAVSDNDSNRLFDFPNWRQGGLKLFQRNKRRIQADIAAATSPEARASGMMRLARLYFANNLGHETLGLLAIVRDENPDIEKNPDFVALRGAANALAGHYQEALKDLSYPPIQQNPEVSLWIGYAAAATEQWKMADRSFPKSNRLLLQYPDNIAIPLTIYMAESALHLGRTNTAKQLLDTVNTGSDAYNRQYRAAMGYLRGEIYSQEGKIDEAMSIWKPVAAGLDRLYHAKASLSLIQLQLKQNKISLKDAITKLEGLSFAWRGDGLEVETLRTLGALKVKAGQALSGLQDMQQAADLAEQNLDDSAPTREDMKRVFRDLFVDGAASQVPPLEAVAAYTQFASLRPTGAEGVSAALDFADYLIRMDLLKQATDMINAQIGNGLDEAKVPSTGAKLAAVCLLDGRAQDALDALKKTERANIALPLMEERTLLHARALSQLKQNDAAIALLSGMSSKNALRLKSDIYWRTQKWVLAAETLESLLPASGSTLSDVDAQTVLNAAVAWKLAGNKPKIEAIKVFYGPAMTATKLASTFDVVTRSAAPNALADRDTMLKIAGEVDVFKSFLDGYKASAAKPSAPPAKN